MTVETTSIEANGLDFTADANLAASGDGELVVLLHGFPHTRHTWRAELRALDERGHRVVAYDQRGYSPGARPDGIDAYRVENLVADALAVADVAAAASPGHGDPKFHVVGHDWGGQLAWIIAALYPERVHSLSVASRPHPSAFVRAMAQDPDQPGRSTHHRRFQRPEATDEFLVDGAAPLRRILESWGAGPDDVDTYLQSLGNHETLDAAINWYRATGPSTLQPTDIPPVTVPTLYVWGDRDASVGRVAAEGTADFVEGRYRFVAVPGGSHCIPDQTPGLFTDLLIDNMTV